MTAQILSGDVFEMLPTIKPGSVDCCVCSPPYWMLRSYLPKGHPLKHLEIGSEPSPGEYVSKMVCVFDLVREAMADHAVCFLNVGDSYSQYNANRGNSKGTLEGRRNVAQADCPRGLPANIDAGNLCLIPQRLAIALQDNGWIVRSVIVWHKPAPIPASVAGWRWVRCRVKVKGAKRGEEKYRAGAVGARPQADHNGKDFASAEWLDCPGCKKCSPRGGYVLRRGSWRPTSSWEPILMLAKKPGYFCDGEPVKTEPAAATVSRDQYTRILDDPEEQFAVQHDHETICSGANLRDVWTIAAEPLAEKHYAAFPSELVSRCLRAGTSAKGYCPACGAPWARVVNYAPMVLAPSERCREKQKEGLRTACDGSVVSNPQIDTIGWRPTCSCNAGDPRPGLVLDPFAGSGRTGLECTRLGLDFVGVDLNSEYVEIATRLLKQEAPLFS